VQIGRRFIVKSTRAQKTYLVQIQKNGYTFICELDSKAKVFCNWFGFTTERPCGDLRKHPSLFEV